LKQNNIDVKVVTFDADVLALGYVKKTNLDWPLLLDPTQQLYQAYGMQRGNWWALYNPVSIWVYLKLILRGRPPGRPGRDWSQLGGDVVIDPNGIVRLQHVSVNPHDRPTIESLLKMVGLE
jgi:alkyl hydroperoxide reductase subunit AhpC